jgi:C-terminal processing protease CtpA/Prc
LAGKGPDAALSESVAAYLNMDMIGRLEDRLSLQGTGSSPDWPFEIERANAPVGLAIVTGRDAYLPTDTTPFYVKGVPVLNAFTGAHSEYSTPRDTADRINAAGTARVAGLMAGIARSLARRAETPAYLRLERPKGSVGRRHIRVYLGTIPDYAKSEVKGVKLSDVMKGGPAEAAGLERGDVIVGLGGTPVANIYDFMGSLNLLKAGEATSIEVMRGGRRLKLSITPAARE